MRKRRIALTAGLIALMMLAMPGAGGAEEDDTDIGEIVENVLLDDDGTEIPEENPEENPEDNCSVIFKTKRKGTLTR